MGIEPKFFNNLIGRKSLKDIKFAKLINGNMLRNDKKLIPCVIGLGYVGLPHTKLIKKI